MKIEAFKKLPDSEFEVMRAIWNAPVPSTAPILMNIIKDTKDWRAPTLISFLGRLEDRGFIRSEKNGKEREYYPLIDEKSYMTQFTKLLLDQYYGGSLKNFLDILSGEESLSSAQYDEILEWLQSHEF